MAKKKKSSPDDQMPHGHFEDDELIKEEAVLVPEVVEDVTYGPAKKLSGHNKFSKFNLKREYKWQLIK